MKTLLIASSVALTLAAAGAAYADHGTRNGAIAGAVGGAVVGGPVGAVVGGVGGAVVGHHVDKHHHYARWCYTRHHHHRYRCG